ncbi:MAG: DUF2945 domain-containing protein [Limisphaerales bacterium]
MTRKKGFAILMKHEFKVGNHVEWNSETGRVRGTIKKKVTTAIRFKTYTVRASKECADFVVPVRGGN